MYFIKEFCLHGRSRYNKCAAVWTLKIPVSPADAFKPTFHPSFLINYWNLEMSANIDCKKMIAK